MGDDNRVFGYDKTSDNMFVVYNDETIRLFHFKSGVYLNYEDDPPDEDLLLEMYEDDKIDSLFKSYKNPEHIEHTTEEIRKTISEYKITWTTEHDITKTTNIFEFIKSDQDMWVVADLLRAVGLHDPQDQNYQHPSPFSEMRPLTYKKSDSIYEILSEDTFEGNPEEEALTLIPPEKLSIYKVDDHAFNETKHLTYLLKIVELINKTQSALGKFQSSVSDLIYYLNEESNNIYQYKALSELSTLQDISKQSVLIEKFTSFVQDIYWKPTILQVELEEGLKGLQSGESAGAQSELTPDQRDKEIKEFLEVPLDIWSMKALAAWHSRLRPRETKRNLKVPVVFEIEKSKRPRKKGGDRKSKRKPIKPIKTRKPRKIKKTLIRTKRKISTLKRKSKKLKKYRKSKK